MYGKLAHPGQPALYKRGLSALCASDTGLKLIELFHVNEKLAEFQLNSSYADMSCPAKQKHQMEILKGFESLFKKKNKRFKKDTQQYNFRLSRGFYQGAWVLNASVLLTYGQPRHNA